MALGGIFGGGSSVQAPDYSQAINTITQAGQTAADRGVFKPVTISTSFGTPQYTYDQQGRLTGAGYTAAPWLQNLQTGQQGLAGTYLTAAQQAAQNQQGLQAANLAFGGAGSLYGAAQQALPTSYDVTGATQDYYNRMQQMVAPQREQQLASTRQNLFNRGRQGLAIGATQAGGMAATNPEMAAYYNAIAQQDLGLANQAEQQALANLAQRTGMATSLFGSGLQQGVGGGSIQNQQYANWVASQQPMGTSLDQLAGMEKMAQSPLALGLQFGAPTTQGMQYGGSMLFNAADRASQFQAQQAEAAARAANANQGGGFWDALGGMAVTAGLGALTGGIGSGLAGSLGLGGLGGAGLFSSLGTGLGGAIGSGFSSSSMNPFSSAGSAMRGAGFGWTPTGYTMPAGGGW